MEISPQLMQQLQVVFRAELAEHLETMTGGVLALEHGAEPSQQQEILENIFRAAHSLKGAAKGVSQYAIADITHRLESIFSLLKKNQLAHSKALFDTVLQALDKIKALSEGAEFDSSELKEFLKKLDECLTGKESASTSVKPATSLHSQPIVAKQEEQELTAPAETQLQPTFLRHSTPEIRENPHSKEQVIDSVPILTVDSNQASYTVLMQDVKQLSLLSEEIQTVKLQVKQHLLEFQQLCVNLDYLSADLNEYVATQFTSSQQEKLPHTVIELAHLSANALNSFNNLRQLNTHFQQVSQSLSNAVNTMRLVPFALLLAPLRRIVRDLSLQQQKKLNFVIDGEEIKIDRNLYKFLHAPLVHLINNAIDHGIEPLEQRLSQGKNEVAQLRLKISKSGADILISLTDDGGGIDLNIIRQKIVKLQLLSANEVKALTNDEVLDFIFKPGFSLAPILTEISGRGVGLDVVKTNLRKIKGTIRVNTTLKKGTEFLLTIPATLSSEAGILVQVNQQKFALQAYNIERVADIKQEELVVLNGKNLLPGANGQPINIYHLGQLLGLPVTRAFSATKSLAVVFITDGEDKIALIVDEILGDQDLIIKPFSYPLLNVPFALGMAILGNGSLLPVLNTGDLIAAASTTKHSFTPESLQPQMQVAKKILVVDDSPTSRTLEKNILEQQGFVVTALENGLAAWQELEKRQHYDLIVTDIEMPLLNGFELVEKIKNNAATAHIPTIVVSSLNSEQDKRRGIQVGADAYITKDAFDSESLLAIIHQLL